MRIDTLVTTQEKPVQAHKLWSRPVYQASMGNMQDAMHATQSWTSIRGYSFLAGVTNAQQVLGQT